MFFINIVKTHSVFYLNLRDVAVAISADRYLYSVAILFLNILFLNVSVTVNLTSYNNFHTAMLYVCNKRNKLKNGFFTYIAIIYRRFSGMFVYKHRKYLHEKN